MLKQTQALKQKKKSREENKNVGSRTKKGIDTSRKHKHRIQSRQKGIVTKKYIKQTKGDSHKKICRLQRRQKRQSRKKYIGSRADKKGQSREVKIEDLEQKKRDGYVKK